MDIKRTKVVLVGYSLSDGGLERVTANLSRVFNIYEDIEVVLIILENKISYSYSGKLINFGIELEKSKSYLSRLKVYLNIKKELDKGYDYIIDCRYRINLLSEIFWSKYIYSNKNVVYTIHSAQLERYISKNKIMAKYILKDMKLVCVSKKLTEYIKIKYPFLKPDTIYNPLDIDEILKSKEGNIDLDFEYIIGIGRMNSDNVKQLDVLIETYSNSILPNNNIHLVLLGDGDKKDEYIMKVKNKGLQDKIHFLGFQQNPFKFIVNSKFLVLTSKKEGFGMVLAEALACGTPIISFDCKYGPSEIIENNKNGLLVENQNKNELLKAINQLYQDIELYEECKKNAEVSISKFSFKEVGLQWRTFLGIDKF